MKITIPHKFWHKDLKHQNRIKAEILAQLFAENGAC